jgi:hypothetical protein
LINLVHLGKGRDSRHKFQEIPMTQGTATRIAQLFYNAAQRQFEAVVEFFAPGLPQPLRVSVALCIPADTPHHKLARALAHEAQRRGIHKW